MTDTTDDMDSLCAKMEVRREFLEEKEEEEEMNRKLESFFLKCFKLHCKNCCDLERNSNSYNYIPATKGE